MKLATATRQWLPLILIAAVAGSFGYFITKITDEASGPFLRNVAPAVSQESLLSFCGLLVLVVGVMGLWVYSIYRQTSPRKFHAQFATFDTQLGAWTHKTAPGYFCPKCKSELLGSPMVERKGAWQCPVCETWAGTPTL